MIKLSSSQTSKCYDKAVNLLPLLTHPIIELVTVDTGVSGVEPQLAYECGGGRSVQLAGRCGYFYAFLFAIFGRYGVHYYVPPIGCLAKHSRLFASLYKFRHSYRSERVLV